VAPVRASVLKVPGDLIFEFASEIKDSIERRAYELFEARGFEHGHDREDWLNAESEILLNLPTDITEGETEFTVHAYVSGFSGKDLELQVAPRCLCISGRHEESSEETEQKAVASQRRSKRIFRMLNLSSEIDPDGVKATVHDGLLEIKLSKVGAREKERLVAKAAAA